MRFKKKNRIFEVCKCFVLRKCLLNDNNVYFVYNVNKFKLKNKKNIHYNFFVTQINSLVYSTVFCDYGATRSAHSCAFIVYSNSFE